MTLLRSKRLHLLLAAALLFAALVALLCLGAGAEVSCMHEDTIVTNGFCREDSCGGYEIPGINEGDPENPDDSYYEIANAGQLYYLKNEILQKKAPETVVRAKLVANIVVTEQLLGSDGKVNPIHLDEEGQVKAEIYRWWINKAVKNVTLDGDGYTISGLYGVSADDAYAAGLFGEAENVTVKNLGLVDSIFASQVKYVGALIAEATGGCVLENCFVLDCTTEGARSAAIVGKLGFSGVVNTVTNCYTDAGRAIYEFAIGNTVSKCYYLSENETDAIEGTMHVAALSDEANTLLTLLKGGDAESAWQISCRRNAPVLRPEHYYKNVCDADCVNIAICGHIRAEGEEGRVPHDFDNKCDVDCNICKNIRELEKTDHYYGNVCDTDCDECGFTREAPESHKYSNQCDKYCNYCQFERTPPIEGHEYSNDCDDECNHCHKKREGAAHTYDNVCDAICNVCATTRVVQGHKYDNACDTSCNDCGSVREITHAFGEYVTVTEPTLEAEGLKERACSVCGVKESEKIAKLVPEPESKLGLYLAIGGGALALAVVIVVVILLLRKKKNAPKAPKEQPEEQAPEATEEEAQEQIPEATEEQPNEDAEN